MQATSFFYGQNADQVRAALAAHDQLLDQFRIAKRIEAYEHMGRAESDCYGVCALYVITRNGILVPHKVYVMALTIGELVAVPDDLHLTGGVYELTGGVYEGERVLCGSPDKPCTFPTSGGHLVRYVGKIRDVDGWTILMPGPPPPNLTPGLSLQTNVICWREAVAYEMTLVRPQRMLEAKEGNPGPRKEGGRRKADGNKRRA